MVDSNDKERIAESAEELSKMVSDKQEVELLVSQLTSVFSVAL